MFSQMGLFLPRMFETQRGVVGPQKVWVGAIPNKLDPFSRPPLQELQAWDVDEKTKADPKKRKGPFGNRVCKLCKKLSIQLGACFGMVGWSKYNNGI